MTKLYMVKATITYVVTAQDIHDAITVARGTLREAVNDQGVDDFDIAANDIPNANFLPFGWKDTTALPYSIDGEQRTIGQLLEVRHD